MNLSSRLKNRIDVYGKVPFINELGEDDFKYGKIKSVWAEITVQKGALKNSQGNTTYADIDHKIVVRTGAIPDLANDMYFMYQGQRYDIKYFNPNYKYQDSIEIFVSLVVS
ncbi:head-tail adaptor protein [Ruminiclostridium cellulolyticum]|uniref:Phage head-tail adaptor n=1 Tax=Ruminiclostridium cellulolyticum (strain ATCC 35319 / DSM 5812 / JCM 6584 / H10) TaxID=394503 RepID=B8I8E8_RUMCH|nr:head-tail adaptor protein [Ruminiclostridium cellulolyticum]ACL77248.1 phage head-tail adaptor [Ruminiclostridium cellulolyticum H10]